MKAGWRYTPVNGGQPAGPGSGEAILDVENLAAMAPGAHIDVYEGPSPRRTPTSMTRWTHTRRSSTPTATRSISTSWGARASRRPQEGQPGLQGREPTCSSRPPRRASRCSARPATTDRRLRHLETPTSGRARTRSPWMTRPASPTSCRSGARRSRRGDPAAHEQVWNDGPNGGAGGGGISAVVGDARLAAGVDRPGHRAARQRDYANADSVEQQLRLPAELLPATVRGRAATPCRLVPDVSAQADEYTGAITVYREGQAAATAGPRPAGTSSATPLWAALLALANASPACASQPRPRRRRLRQPAAVRGGVEPGRVRRLVQRHHRGQQRHLRPRRWAGVPGRARLRPGVWPGIAAADRARRHPRSRLLPVQLVAASAGTGGTRLAPAPGSDGRRREGHRSQESGFAGGGIPEVAGCRSGQLPFAVQRRSRAGRHSR